MPEVHKNQIKWDAPEPSKVTLDKPDYSYLTKALNSLANDSQNIADTQAKMLDDKLAADLNEQLNLANQDIENARSVTADFDSLGEKALSRIQAALGQYDTATQKRFLRANPHYIDNTQLAISEKILKRKRDIFETSVENNLPLWTSQAIVAGTKEARNDVIHTIQESLGNISYESTVDNMIFKANQMMDNATIGNLIAKGTEESLKEAERYLRDPKTTSTIDAYKRTGWFGQISDAYARLEKEKEKNKPEDKTADLILDAYIELKRTGKTAAADDLFRLVVNTDAPIVRTSPAGWGLDANGKAIPQYFDLSKMSATQRAGLGLEMRKYRNLDPYEEYKDSEYRVAVNDALSNLQIASKNKTSEQGAIISNITGLIADTDRFSSLEPGTQDKLTTAIDKYKKAIGETITGHKTYVNTAPFAAKTIGVPVEELGALVSHAKSPEVRNAMRVSDYLQDPLIAWKTRPQTFTDVMTSFGGEEIAEGQLIVDSTADTVNEFFKDTEPNGVARFGINAVGLLEGFKRSGKLGNTRLNNDEGYYGIVLTNWVNALKYSGTMNKQMTDADDKDVKSLFKLIVGDTSFTKEEQEIVDEIIRRNKNSQASRTASSIVRALSTPEARTVYKVPGSNPTPNVEQWRLVNEINSSEKVEKAYKNVKKE